MFPCQCTGPTGNGIKYGYIDACGNLNLVYDNDFVNTVGNVVGPTGYTGPIGISGPTGPIGNGIEYMYLDGCCNLMAMLTNGTLITIGAYCCINSFYYGENIPSSSEWPTNTYPTPSTNPILGNVYITTSGCIYIFDGSNWNTCNYSPPTLINDSNFNISVYTNPSETTVLFPVDINGIIPSSFEKNIIYEGDSYNSPNQLWPPPLNSSYFICKEYGVYTIECGIDYSKFEPTIMCDDVIFYILNSDNNFTGQSIKAGTNSTIVMEEGYKIVVYLKGISNTNITSINENCFIEIKKRI